MISELRHWKNTNCIFEMTIKILSILKRADDQEQFFEFNALNREAFNLYNLDRE